MTPHQSTDQYMFLIVGYEWDKDLSADETRQALDKMMGWFDAMLKSGVATGGSPLARHGKIVGGKNGSMVADGPFAEAKEVVGGYIAVRAESLEAATAIAKKCPLLEYGVTLDVREMVNECAISARLKEQAALATA